MDTTTIHAWIDANAAVYGLLLLSAVALLWKLERARQPARAAQPAQIQTQTQPAPSVLRDPYAGE